MSYSIENHKLTGSQVQQINCSGKDSGVFTPNQPDTVVIHFTAGSSLESAVSQLTAPEVKASAHMVIGREGEVRQLIGFDRIAWHAGQSEWNGRLGLNRYSIGIELDNAGRMSKSGSAFISWFGRKYTEDQVIQAIHRNETKLSFWHIYTEPQLEVCFFICRCLARNYPIRTIVGHEEISPRRKIDPGPAFPLDRLRDQILLGRADDQAVAVAALPPVTTLTERAVVSANLLNFRELPSANAKPVGDPLVQGTRVEILERRGKWCRVNVSKQGWLHGDYLLRES